MPLTSRLLLLWAAGASLRMTLLAVPPLLPSIHADLALDEKAVGALTGLPVLLLAAAALPGSLLIARVGARWALVAGLSLIAGGGAARGLGSSIPVLFAMTFVMGAGVAMCQPAMPSLVGRWFPRRVGLATATYSNGLLIGELAAAALTVPLILPLIGGWQPALAFWSLPVAATALAMAFMRAPAERLVGPAVRWWPDWRSPLTWRLGLLLGAGQVSYWGGNAYLPDYLKATGHPEVLPAALASLNLVQLVASFLVAVRPGQLVGRRWPFVACGALTVVCAVGLMAMTGVWVILWAGLLGFAAALILILNLALPPLLLPAREVHLLSAATFTISYTGAFVGPLIGGALWDATGVPATAFVPVLVGGLVIVWLARGFAMPVASGQ